MWSLQNCQENGYRNFILEPMHAFERYFPITSLDLKPFFTICISGNANHVPYVGYSYLPRTDIFRTNVIYLFTVSFPPFLFFFFFLPNAISQME